MPDLWFRGEHDQLRRIADSLEELNRILRRDLAKPETRSVDLMSLPAGSVAPGDTGTFTATANSNGTEVPGAVLDVVSSDETLLTLASDGAAGVATITWTAIAAGSPVVTANTTNPDGTVISAGTNNPFTFTVAEPVATVATSVDLA